MGRAARANTRLSMLKLLGIDSGVPVPAGTHVPKTKVAPKRKALTIRKVVE